MEYYLSSLLTLSVPFSFFSVRIFSINVSTSAIDSRKCSTDANIIETCFIGENVVLKNATVGPFVSIGDDSAIENSTVKNSLIQTNTSIKNANLDNAMIGNYVQYNGNFTSISIGDYSVLE